MCICKLKTNHILYWDEFISFNSICRRKEKNKKQRKHQSFILLELLVFKSFIILVSFDVRDEDLSVDTHIGIISASS
jgi:hypothetical protein